MPDLTPEQLVDMREQFEMDGKLGHGDIRALLEFAEAHIEGESS